MERVRIEIEATLKDNVTKQARSLNRELDGLTKKKRSVMIDAKDNGARGTIRNIERTASSLIKRPFRMAVSIVDKATSPLRKIFNYATSLKGILTGIVVGGAFKKSILSPMGLADMYEQSLIAFEGILGDTKKAKGFMGKIEDFATATPFDAKGVTNAVQQLMRMGVSDENSVFKDLEVIGDVASAAGKGTEGVEGIARAFSEIISKDKLMGQELIQLANQGVMAKQYLKDAYGVENFTEIEKMNKKGLISAQDAVKVIMEGMRNDSRYAGSMTKNATRTLSGLREQIQDTFENKIFKRWGMGLADGVKPGMVKFLNYLDANEEKIGIVGNKLQDLGSKISSSLVDFLAGRAASVGDLMNNEEFNNAGTIGKVRLIFDELIGNPVSDWWSKSGRDSAMRISKSIGGFIFDGIVGGLKEGLFEIGNSLVDLLPGGDKATGGDWLLGGIGILGGMKAIGGIMDIFRSFFGGTPGLPVLPGLPGPLGDTMTINAGIVNVNGNLAGMTTGNGAIPLPGPVGAGKIGMLASLAGKFGSSATGLAATAVGGAGLVGAIGGLTGVVAGIKDLINGKKWEGGSKIGMVGAGAAAGALAGSFVPVIGTAIGGAIGAGLGGLGALFKGDSVGQFLESKFSGADELNTKFIDAGTYAEAFGTTALGASDNTMLLGNNAMLASQSTMNLGSVAQSAASSLASIPSVVSSLGGIGGSKTSGPKPKYGFGLAAHAEGGIFNTPHIAQFAEDGPEAIIPMTKSQGPQILRDTANRMGLNLGGGGTPTINTPVNIYVSGADGDVVKQIEENMGRIAESISKRIAFSSKVSAANQW